VAVGAVEAEVEAEVAQPAVAVAHTDTALVLDQ